MKLVALALEHKEALTDFIADFKAAGEDRIPAFLPAARWTFEETVVGFERQSRGEDLPEGWVPGTTRFLEDDGRLLGVFNLRHWLTDGLRRFGGHVGYSVRPSERRKGYGTLLLKGALALARGMNIDAMLVTCDASNAASIGVITACGGALEDQFIHDELGHEVNRYWVAVSAASEA